MRHDGKFLLNKVEVGVSGVNVSVITILTLKVLLFPSWPSFGQTVIHASARPTSRRQGLTERTDMLPDLSRTKHTILCPICSSEKVGLGGFVVIGVVFLKSSES